MPKKLPGQEHGEPGAPRKEIDTKLLTKLKSIGCTNDEIQAVMGVSADTLQRRAKDTPAVKEALETGAAKGRATLRRAQWQGAMKGNTGMLVWLGKQLLGQRDYAQIAHTGPNDGPIKTETTYADLKKLPQEDLWTLREILTRRAAAEEQAHEGSRTEH